MRQATGLTAAIAAALALAACGGGDDGSPQQPATTEASSPAEAEVADVIEQAAATRNADDCAKLATPAFVEQTQRLKGNAALAACQAGTFDRDQGLLPEPLTVAAVSPGPTAATAEVFYEAGNPDAGLRARVRVVNGELDAIKDYVEADRPAMERAYRNELLDGPVPIERPAADCAVSGVASRSDQQLESLLLHGSLVEFAAPAVRCGKASVEVAIVAAVAVRLPFLTTKARACAGAEMRATPAARLVRLVVETDQTGAAAIVLRCDLRGSLAAYRRVLTGPDLGYSERVAGCMIRKLQSKSPGALASVLTETGVKQIAAGCR